MPSPSPLSKTELTALQETADRRGYYSEKLIVNIIPYTGLRPTEFGHLRDSWIRWGDDEDPALIDIPMSESCSSLKIDGTNNIVERTEPCSECRRSGETDGWAAVGACRERSIPISNPRAINHLEWWFDDRGHQAIPVYVNGVGRILNRIVQESSLSRTVDTCDLRLTFVRMLAAMDFDREFITDCAGYSHANDTIKTILEESPNQYRELLRSKEYAKILETKGPMTPSEMASEVDRSIDNTYDVLDRLHDRGYIEIVQTYSTSKNGRHNIVYDCTKTLTEFDCSICNKTFSTQRGLSVHSGRMHT